MVDYDAAVAAVQDRNADPILLAKIAYENPEFGANVAVNPRAYPGLLRWLAEFGDDRARETVRQMGYAVSDDAAGAVQSDETVAVRQHTPAASTASTQATATQATNTTTQEPHAARSPQTIAQSPVNAHGFTEQIARTTTDQMQMAEIAQKAPELYAALAQNPNLYPALVDWLSRLGDPAVDAALAARR